MFFTSDELLKIDELKSAISLLRTMPTTGAGLIACGRAMSAFEQISRGKTPTHNMMLLITYAGQDKVEIFHCCYSMTVVVGGIYLYATTLEDRRYCLTDPETPELRVVIELGKGLDTTGIVNWIDGFEKLRSREDALFLSKHSQRKTPKF